MKIKLSTGNRVGRDRRPHSRKIYAMWTVFWAVMLGLYVQGLFTGGVRDLWGGEIHVGLSWFFAAVSAVYMIFNARIWLQHADRVVEWADHVREHNAAMRARYAPDANPSMFDKEN